MNTLISFISFWVIVALTVPICYVIDADNDKVYSVRNSASVRCYFELIKRWGKPSIIRLSRSVGKVWLESSGEFSSSSSSPSSPSKTLSSRSNAIISLLRSSRRVATGRELLIDSFYICTRLVCLCLISLLIPSSSSSNRCTYLR